MKISVSQTAKQNILVYGSLILSLWLMLFSVPLHWVWAKPLWVPLTLIFWLIHTPRKVGVNISWLMGLLVDILYGGALGQYALSYLLLGCLTLQLRRRLYFYSLFQQMLVIGVLLIVSQLVLVWIQVFISRPSLSLWYWGAPLTSMLVWPFVYLFLSRFCQRSSMSFPPLAGTDFFGLKRRKRLLRS